MQALNEAYEAVGAYKAFAEQMKKPVEMTDEDKKLAAQIKEQHEFNKTVETRQVRRELARQAAKEMFKA